MRVYHLPNSEVLDWKQFGEDVMGFFSNVGTFDFMYEFHSDLTLGMAACTSLRQITQAKFRMYLPRNK